MDDAERAGVLNVPARARLYRAVVDAYPRWLSRDQAAAAAGLSRSLAAFHLDRLAAVGLLETASRRLGERQGPGGGRPAKLYRRSSRPLELSLPPRRYQLAAELMTRALEAGGSEAALLEAARRAGAEAAGGVVTESLERLGYEPLTAGGVIRLRNCPFHALAERHRDLVCGMNHALLSGLVAAASGGLTAELAPEPGFCCVRLRAGRRAE